MPLRLIKNIFSFLLLFYSTGSFSQVKYLIPYRDGGLWGYADTGLHIIVPPRYDEANIYWMGCGIVRQGLLYGCLDASGKEIVPASYYHQIAITGNYLLVKRGDSAGIISAKNGRVLLPAIYESVYPIFAYTFFVAARHQRKGLFNAATGKWLLPAAYEDISFHSVLLHTNFYPYYIARKKNKVVYFTLSDKGVFSRIQPVKEIIIRDTAMEAANQRPPQEVMEDTSITLNWQRPYTRNGKSGFYIVTIKNRVETLVDSIPPVFDSISLLKEDATLFLVGREGRQGIITRTNKEVVPLVYDEVKPVDSTPVHGIYIVKKSGRYGLARGKSLLLPCEYDKIISMNSDTRGFILYKDHKSGIFLYDRERQLTDILIPANYDYTNGLTGICNANFILFANCRVQDYKTRLFLVRVAKNGKMGYTGLNGKAFFRDN
jgi:hypothetical protein